MDVESKRCY